MQYIKRLVMGLLFLAVLYLTVVWIWANSVAPSLLQEERSTFSATAIQVRHLDALIQIEDPTFYSHTGVDISNGQGLTTITSSLAKLIFLGDRKLEGLPGAMQAFYRAVFRCCKRIDLGRDVMALVLNSHLTKDDQIELFLDSAYLGSLNGKDVVGFSEAAVVYYGKPLGELTDDEFYGIVAMLIAPNLYHPIKNRRLHTQRVERIAAVVGGQCKPSGWLDLTYDQCTAKTRSDRSSL